MFEQTSQTLKVCLRLIIKPFHQRHSKKGTASIGKQQDACNDGNLTNSLCRVGLMGSGRAGCLKLVKGMVPRENEREANELVQTISRGVHPVSWVMRSLGLCLCMVFDGWNGCLRKFPLGPTLGP